MKSATIMATVLKNSMVRYTMYENNLFVGCVRYKMNKPNSVLCRMNISSTYRNKGYGSRILELSERSLCESFDIQRIHLTAWQPAGSSNIVDFYQKNGFDSSTDTSYVYDDYVQLYDLYPMSKSISE